MPMTYAGGFSMAMCSRFVIFVPGVVTSSLHPPKDGEGLTYPATIVAAVCAVMLAVHGSMDSAGVTYLVFTFLYLRGFALGNDQSPSPKTYGSSIVKVVAVLLGFIYGFCTPIAGVQAMASSTMYGNLKQFGGTNHILVPTGVLQAYFSNSNVTGPAWAVDAFGGGMLRIDETNSSVMQQLSPAEATTQLPEHSRALLTKFGTSGRYFELYAARNYFGRTEDLQNSALHDRGTFMPRTDDPPYAQVAYELRRVLTLVRARGERFKLKYTRLPYNGSPAEYRDFQGPQVVLEEDASTGKRTCTVGNAPCSPDEIALMPAPQRWLTWLFHPYPMPLLPKDTTEVHCST